MSYELTQTQFEATLQLNEEYRYQYFFTWIKKVKEFYILKNNEGYLLLEEDDPQNQDAQVVLPVWPHKDFAKNFAQNHPAYQDYEPLAIKLEVFCTSWTPVFTDKNIAIAIFPLKNDESCILLAEDFKKEVTNEK